MGRIKSLTIKRTAKKLLEENPDIFTENFEKNKKIIQELVECDKRTRNKLAGYITKLKKQEK
ncbi:MAG: 30S ribosomal protein S17e [Candidatus Pacearchaeota archaeon]|nr:30S ribosomal protein S17e [Candidatus Pacearchaeota archaeon]